jgi:hypothetical protein
MKPWQAPSQHPARGKETRRLKPQSGSQRGKPEPLKFQSTPPPVARSISEKEREGKPEKAISLEQPPLPASFLDAKLYQNVRNKII